MEGLIRNTGEGALRSPGQHDIARHDECLFSASSCVGRTPGVIIRTLHKVDMRPRSDP
jgi:hypothetical protein